MRPATPENESLRMRPLRSHVATPNGCTAGASSTEPERPRRFSSQAASLLDTAIRLARFVWWMTFAAVVVSSARVRPAAATQRLLVKWAQGVCRALELTVDCRTGLPPPGVLLVANHASWLDPIVIAAAVHTPVMAKSEIRRWPIAGGIVRTSGGVFIDRSSLNGVADAVAALTARLQEGQSLCVFAELGMSDGVTVNPFGSAIFQAAVEAHAAVLPVAIAYHRNQAVSASHIWGSRNFLETMWAVVCAGPCTVTLSAADLISKPAGRTELACLTHRACLRQLQGVLGVSPSSAECAIDDTVLPMDSAVTRLLAYATGEPPDEATSAMTLPEFGIDSLSLVELSLHIDNPAILHAAGWRVVTIGQAVELLRAAPSKRCLHSAYSAKVIPFEGFQLEIERLRYEVYILEQAKAYAAADHEARRLPDRDDASATHVGLFDDGNLVGCARVHTGDFFRCVGNPALRAWLSEAGPQYQNPALLSRLMIRFEHRDSEALVVLFEHIASMAVSDDVDVLVCHANPALAERYQRLGFEPAGCSFMDDEVGEQTILVLDANRLLAFRSLSDD
jgi:1-acyl-sn-glycerol-3-phosphate acyltransferase